MVCLGKFGGRGGLAAPTKRMRNLSSAFEKADKSAAYFYGAMNFMSA
jgi:hypothetical protein